MVATLVLFAELGVVVTESEKVRSVVFFTAKKKSSCQLAVAALAPV